MRKIEQPKPILCRICKEPATQMEYYEYEKRYFCDKYGNIKIHN
jgi:uncharacterized CHY-type Zn-finger protein